PNPVSRARMRMHQRVLPVRSRSRRKPREFSWTASAAGFLLLWLPVAACEGWLVSAIERHFVPSIKAGPVFFCGLFLCRCLLRDRFLRSHLRCCFGARLFGFCGSILFQSAAP